MGDRDEERERFIERIGTLTGRTTYRVPVGGRATGNVLTDQDVAAAIAMGRRRHKDGTTDDRDTGPEILYAMRTETRYRKPDVCSRLTELTLSHFPTKHRYRAAKAVNAAYEWVVMRVELEKPVDVPERLWSELYSTASMILQTEAEGALQRAERAFRRAA